MMLGLEPEPAGAVALELQRMELVRYADERLALIDPHELRGVSCECYEAQLRYAPAAA